MKTLSIASDLDLTSIPHIDRRTDGATLYLIESEADYAALPEALQPTPAAPGVPEEVSMAQARLALHRSGLLALVDAAIQAAGDEAAIEWEFRQTVHRHSALVLQMTAALGWSNAQVDELFRLAETL